MQEVTFSVQLEGALGSVPGGGTTPNSQPGHQAFLPAPLSLGVEVFSGTAHLSKVSAPPGHLPKAALLRVSSRIAVSTSRPLDLLLI